MKMVCIDHITGIVAAKPTVAKLLIFKKFLRFRSVLMYCSVQTTRLRTYSFHHFAYFPPMRLILTWLKKTFFMSAPADTKLQPRTCWLQCIGQARDGFGQYLSVFCCSIGGLVPLSVHSHNPGLNNLHTTRLHCLCCVCICTSPHGSIVHEQHLSFGRV